MFSLSAWIRYLVKNLRLSCFFVVFTLLGACSHHHLVKLYNTPQPLTTANNWVTLMKEDLLIASSQPISTSTDNTKRGMHYIMIAYDTKQQNYVVSTVAGDELKTGSTVLIKVNYDEYSLDVYKDRAWLTDKKEVKRLLTDLQKADILTVISEFSDGTEALDNYSLSGFEASSKLLLLNKIK